MPSNLFLTPITNLQSLLAGTARWQELTGAESAAAAAAAIYKQSCGDEDKHPRPRAIVGTTGNRSLRRITTTGFQMTAPLFLEIQLDTPDEYIGDHNAAFDWFMLEVETLIEQMAGLAGTDGYLDVTEFLEAEPPLPFAEELNDGREYWGTIWEIEIIG